MASALIGSLTGNDGDSYYNSLDWDKASDNSEDVPSYKIDTSQDYGGVGYTPYQQSYTVENKPSWMQGIWDMPEWGYDVSGNALTQQDLQPASQASSDTSGSSGSSDSSKSGGSLGSSSGYSGSNYWDAVENSKNNAFSNMAALGSDRDDPNYSNVGNSGKRVTQANNLSDYMNNMGYGSSGSSNYGSTGGSK